MKSIIKTFSLLSLVLFIFPGIAHAHLIGGNGLVSGLTHPLFGLDHLLAMIAVGVISTQIKGKGIWKVPAIFVVFMILGGILSINGFAISIAEIGISLSVLFFGLFIIFPKKISLNFIIMGVALFAIFHGHAHGSEMPLIANPVFYAIGFVVSTTLLHIMGVIIGYYSKKTQLRLELLRYAGVGISAIGLFLLFGF